MKKMIGLMLLCILYLVGCEVTNEISPIEETKVVEEQPQEETKDSVIIKEETSQTNDTYSNSTNQTETIDSNQTPSTEQKMSRLYYYDVELNQMFYVDKEVTVFENAYVTALTEAIKENQNNENFVTINEKTFVTSATLDKENGILSVYFNESFYHSTNLGTAIEVGFIDSLVNTYGYNYNVDKVAIYVEGKLYEDQRGPMQNGYFTVTDDIATKYK